MRTRLGLRLRAGFGALLRLGLGLRMELLARLGLRLRAGFGALLRLRLRLRAEFLTRLGLRLRTDLSTLLRLRLRLGLRLRLRTELLTRLGLRLRTDFSTLLRLRLGLRLRMELGARPGLLRRPRVGLRRVLCRGGLGHPLLGLSLRRLATCRVTLPLHRDGGRPARLVAARLATCGHRRVRLRPCWLMRFAARRVWHVCRVHCARTRLTGCVRTAFRTAGKLRRPRHAVFLRGSRRHARLAVLGATRHGVGGRGAR